jgi:CheY-like chemotaxis protein
VNEAVQPAARLRLVLVEDDADDAELILRTLRVAGYIPEATIVDDEKGFVAALSGQPQVILTDYSLPNFDGIRAMDLARAIRPEVPVLVVTGFLGDEAAAECVKHGAVDYLLKDRLARLGYAVLQATRSAHTAPALLDARYARRPKLVHAPFSLLPSPDHNDETIPGNILLAAIPAKEYGEFRGLLEMHALTVGETLQEAGDPPDYVYFPTGGIISVVTALENGMMVEFAAVGREGMTGTPVVLGVAESNMALVCSVPGAALRMRTEDFLAQMEHSPGLAGIIRRYNGAMFALVAQTAACNRAHRVEERSARWLLMTYDQAGGRFPITQEFLAQMLGVSRPSVTLSAAALQKAGLITYHWGEVTIKDRLGLEKAACECYAVIREHFRRLWD